MGSIRRPHPRLTVATDDLSSLTLALWMQQHEAFEAMMAEPRSEARRRQHARAVRAFHQRLVRLEKVARLAWRTRRVA
jgi:hypothetical protein